MERRYDIDWLRVFATYLLFVFHVAMVFNPAPFYHIRNDELSFGMLVFAGFVSLWHMPLFFLLAGWSLHASLAARGTTGVLRERVLRLWVPLAMACVLLMPSIKYLELRSGLDLNHAGLFVAPHLQAGFQPIVPRGLPVAPAFTERFFEFLPTFFTHLDRFTWAHMWFVAYLLTFTVVLLPLLAWILRARPRFVPRGAAWLYLPILPLALVQLTLRARWPGLQNLYDDWANVAYYGTYLLAGFLLAHVPALEDTVRSEWKRALGLGLATVLVLLLGLLGVFSSGPVMLAGSAVAGWCFVVALLGAARRYMCFSNATHRYLTESAFPVYILHQSAIVLPGYFIIQSSLGIAAKFCLVLATAVVVTLAVSHLLVRRFALLRLLFGMKAPSRRVAPLGTFGKAVGASAAVLLLVAAPARGTGGVEGVWYAEGGAAKVEISRCNEALCGRVVWLRSPFDEHGCPLRDRYNPDESLRARPVLGVQILRDLRADGAGGWTDGSIYDPATGNTYRAMARLEGSDRLQLRGYLGIPLLGRTTRWFRVGSEPAQCRDEL